MAGILGLSIGTRILGLAVIHKDELIDWRVKSFKEQWSKEKHTAIVSAIERTVDTYTVTTIVCKEVPETYCTQEVQNLIEAVQQIAQERGISYISYSIEELRLSGMKKKATKKDVLRYTIDKHPYLKKHYEQEQKSRQVYYTKMFEAIALAEGYIRNH